MESEATFQRRWYMRRSLYRWGVFAWFVVLAFFAGPKFFWWLWDVKPAPSSPEYFVPVVQRYGVPLVRKMKEYHRIYGAWPKSVHDCAPELEQGLEGDADWTLTSDGSQVWKFRYYAELRHVIEYDFTPGHEQWTVSGHFVNGVLPLPPVQFNAETQPATQQ